MQHWKQNNKHIHTIKKITSTHIHTIHTIHEHTLTQYRKNIDTYTTHAHLHLRVLVCIHHAYNKHTLSLTLRYTHNTQMQKHTHTQKNNTHTHTSNNTHTTWTGRHTDRGVPVEDCFKSKVWEGTVQTCWTKVVNFRSWSETLAA